MTIGSRIWTVVLAVCLLGLAVAPVAQGDKEFEPGGIFLEILDAAGKPAAIAGSHPDRMLTRLVTPGGSKGEPAKDFEIAFPNGMGGNPANIPTCKRSNFDSPDDSLSCPIETRIGSMRTITLKGEETIFPIFNLVPAPGEVAAFGVQAGFIPYKFSSRLRRNDLGLWTRSSSGLLRASVVVLPSGLGHREPAWNDHRPRPVRSTRSPKSGSRRTRNLRTKPRTGTARRGAAAASIGDASGLTGWARR
jgi:hypothetical protein